MNKIRSYGIGSFVCDGIKIPAQYAPLSKMRTSMEADETKLTVGLSISQRDLLAWLAGDTAFVIKMPTKNKNDS